MTLMEDSMHNQTQPQKPFRAHTLAAWQTFLYGLSGTALFMLGLVVVAWVAAVHASNNPMVLGVCLLIAVVYLIGGAELQRYRKATAGLQTALDTLQDTPAELAHWLHTLDVSLRAAVGLRVAGERVALPAPTLPAYLSGVLVLLGMLGTLLGMMVTLRGTGIALESASDLQAIRDSLAAPVKGLGYAFGTSIAGIASSAVLGVLTTLCRRQRLFAARALDTAIAGPLQVFTRDHRQEGTWQLLHNQSALLPTLVERLQTLADAIERRDAVAHAQQAERQQTFLDRNEAAYLQLAERVQRSLQDGVAKGADAASRVLQPVVQATMAEIASSAHRVHERVAQTMQTQVQASHDSLQTATGQIAVHWQQAMQAQSAAQATAWDAAMVRQQAAQAALVEAQQQVLSNTVGHFQQQAEALLAQLAVTQRDAQTELAAQDSQRLDAWRTAMVEHGEVLCAAWAQLGESSAQRQQQMCDALQASAEAIATNGRQQANATLTEIGTLMQAAAEAPRVAAEVIGELRQSLADSMQRDTAMLAERNQLLDTLGALLDAVNRASGEQARAIETLVGTSSQLLETVGARFDARIEADAQKLDAAATRASASALEIASLGDAFAAAVDAFGANNTQMAERLQTIERALEKSLLRSDEQLAYYVAQAREVVDLSLLAQRQIVDDLRQLEVQRGALSVA